MNKALEVALRLNLSGFSGKLGAASAQVRQFGADVKRSGAEAAKGITDAPSRNVEKIGKASLVAGGLLAAGIGMAVKATMDFDVALSDLQAATGASTAEMGRLRDQAIDAGAATSFSASEAAEAQTELAKAGVSTADILGGALNGSLNLAAAGSLDLATSATYAANAMTTFGLSGKDVGHIADVFAAGANKSAADVDQIGQALQQTGLVADQFGLTLDDTVGTLALFHQNALKGSDAGTSMKTMLSSFIPKSAEAAETMQQLGLEFFNSRGEFIGIQGAADQLKTKLSGLSQEQRMAALQTIFGADAIRAASILYESGGDGVRQWTNAVNDSGYAAEVAETKMDNLSGDLEALKGSIETALIQGGSKATGALRFLVQGATDAVNVFSDLPGPVQTGVMAFGGIASAAFIAVGAIGTMVPKLQAGMAALETMGTAGQTAAAGIRALGSATVTLGKVGLVVGGLVALHQVINDIGDTTEKADLSKLTRDLLDTADAGRVVGDELDSTMQNLRESMNDSDLQDGSKHVRQALNDIDDGLADLARRDPDAAARAFRVIKRELQDMGVPAEVAERGMNAYASAVAEAETASRIAASAQDELGGSSGAAADGMSDVASAAEDAEQQVSDFKDTLDGLLGRFQSVPAAADQVQETLREIRRQFNENGSAMDGNSEAALANRDAMRGLVEDQYDLIQAMQEQGATAPQLQLAQMQAIDQIERLGQQYGLTEEQVRTYTDQLLAAPTEVGTEITADDTQSGLAFSRNEERLNAWNAARGTATADTDRSPAEASFRAAFARLQGWDGSTGTADAYLADWASTPLGQLTLRMLGWDGRTGTADAFINDLASGPLGGIIGDLNSVDGRSVSATVRIGYEVYGQAELNRFNALRGSSRWGNVTNARGQVVAAASGFAWNQAGIVDQPTMLFGERETGGEAYIPKNGDTARSERILATAAGWYGMELVPKQSLIESASARMTQAMSGSGGGAYTYAPVINNTVNIEVAANAAVDAATVSLMRSEVERGIDRFVDDLYREMRTGRRDRGVAVGRR